jgi:hypothetical protein
LVAVVVSLLQHPQPALEEHLLLVHPHFCRLLVALVVVKAQVERVLVGN